METKEEYVSLLDILSLTREAKNAIESAREISIYLDEAQKAIQSAEQLVVADVLKGRRFVAFSEKGNEN